MKTAIGYIRVSTEQQAKEGVSLEAQEAKILEWCKANGYSLLNIYRDEGITGTRQDIRAGWIAATKALKRDMVLVSYSMSRLARSAQDLLNLRAEVSKKKASLVSLTEALDDTTPAGRFQFTVMAGVAELERDMIAQRTRAALQHKKATGQKYTNITPYGFEAIEGRLVEVKQEAAVVAEIQAARAGGNTLQSIADRLNGRGIPTKTGKTWQPATIHLLMKRTALVAAH